MTVKEGWGLQVNRLLSFRPIWWKLIDNMNLPKEHVSIYDDTNKVRNFD